MTSDFSYIISAPGKVILFGEHSVVYKKAAVSTAISRRLYVTINSLKDEQVLLKLPQINSEVVFDFNNFSEIVRENCPLQSSTGVCPIFKPDEIDHDVYVQSLKSNLENLRVDISSLPEKTVAAVLGFLYVMRGMCHSLNCSLVPFSLVVKSELEVGAGTGSSAAFAVAISASVLRYRKCLEIANNLTTALPEVQDNVIISSVNKNSGFSVDERRIINKWAYCLEKIMHGRPSGIDNTTCTFGSVVVTSQEKSAPGNLTFRFLEQVPNISILLVSTGVSRNTAHLVAKVRKLREENCAAVDAILNAMDVIAKEAFKTLDGLGITCDSSKTAEMYTTLGGLMDLNHGLLRTLGVSHESLEHIVSVSERHGLSSKLTGAGGGGYAITLIPPFFSREKLDLLKNELGPEFKVTEINIAEQGVRLEQ